MNFDYANCPQLISFQCYPISTTILYAAFTVAVGAPLVCAGLLLYDMVKGMIEDRKKRKP